MNSSLYLRAVLFFFRLADKLLEKSISLGQRELEYGQAQVEKYAKQLVATSQQNKQADTLKNNLNKLLGA